MSLRAASGRRAQRALALALLGHALGLAVAALGQGERTLPEHDASRPEAPTVTAANLLHSERFWPYRASLVRAWQPPSAPRALPAGATGVLIRVESDGRARIDFGRDGLHQVPIDATDLVARADAVRRGERDKMAPNLVLAIGPRLIDSSGPELQVVSMSRVFEASAFLFVFADPESPDFPDLAGALAPLVGREGLLVALFPVGNHADQRVRERLRALDWTVPFVYDHLAEPYAKTLLPSGLRAPAVLLQTRQGRVLYAAPFGPDVPAALTAALDGAASAD